MTAKQVQIGDRSCRIYGADCAEYLLLQMTDEHELQRMDNEVAAIAQGAAHPFLFATVPVKNWNDALSPWKSPAVWGKQGFGGNAAETLRFLTEQVIPTLKRQFHLPENIKIILGGYSLAGLFAHCGHPLRQSCSTVSPPPRPLFGFRAGWSLNNSARYRRSAFI